jgi:hypothetical protein
MGRSDARAGHPVMTVDFKLLSDESLLAHYESLRRQAVADTKLDGKAEQLQKEMQDRRLRYIPIEWR